MTQLKYRYRYSHTGWRWLLLLCSLPGVSCSKQWLDAKTNTNLAVPSTIGDFQSLMDNTDIINGNSCGIGEVASDGHYIVPASQNSEGGVEFDAYTWTKDKVNSMSTDWVAAYKRVAYCNVVLEGLQGITPTNSNDRQTWNAVKGNALFQRARTFFELAQVFAPAWTPSPAAGNWGIPLRLSSDIYAPTVRSTVAATYNQITGDLLTAKDLLPVTAPYKTRASKPAAMALLARIYLAMEQYDLAALYADSCLQFNNTLLDYNSFNSANTGYVINQLNAEVIFHATMVKWGNITSDALVDSTLYASYDAHDLRRLYFFKPATSPGAPANSWAFRGSYNNSVVLFSGLAVDEMYLIAAECNARKGLTAAANSIMDSLLRRRIAAAYFTPFAATDANVLARVLQERRKELLFRGLRWPDLRRLNRDPAFAQIITHPLGTQPYSLAPNSYQYTLPIPDDILQLSGMAQNPGW